MAGMMTWCTWTLVVVTLLYTAHARDLRKNEKKCDFPSCAEEYKRNIWKLTDQTSTSTVVHLQRTVTQRHENGYWMLQYKCLEDVCQPGEWTNTRDKFYKWGQPELGIMFEDRKGRQRRMGGMVRLEGLVPGYSYGLRTLYSLKQDGSNPEIQPDPSKKEDGYVFQTPPEAVNKKQADDNLYNRLVKALHRGYSAKKRAHLDKKAKQRSDVEDSDELLRLLKEKLSH